MTHKRPLFDKAQKLYNTDPTALPAYLQALPVDQLFDVGKQGVYTQSPVMIFVVDALEFGLKNPKLRPDKYWETLRHWSASAAHHNDVELLEHLNSLTQKLGCSKQVWELQKGSSSNVVCPIISAATSSSLDALAYLKTPQPSEGNLQACVFACENKDISSLQVLLKDNQQSIIPHLIDCPNEHILEMLLKSSPNKIDDLLALALPHLNHVHPSQWPQSVRPSASGPFPPWKVQLIDHIYASLSDTERAPLFEKPASPLRSLGEHIEEFLSRHYIEAYAPQTKALLSKNNLLQAVNGAGSSKSSNPPRF